jgi:aryl-alcohol dehydrogenase-like predicted oxidoreductase
MPSLLLGTAQWGLDYGITNTRGRLSDPELENVVAIACWGGVKRLDTAPGYGDAESRIGLFAPNIGVQTKVAGVSNTGFSPQEQLRESLAKLQRQTVDSVLVHDWPILSADKRRQMRTALKEAQDLGLVEEVGVSIYESADLESLSLEFPEATLVQAPVSVLDQRILRTWRAHSPTGARLQARSVFLQGLILGSENSVPFGNHPDIVRLRAIAHHQGVSVTQLSLDFIRSQPEISEVVLASSSAIELEELLLVWGQPSVKRDSAGLASLDEVLLDPRRWPVRN